MARDMNEAAGPPEEVAVAGLRYVGDGHPGLTRSKARHGFNYCDAKGEAVGDEATLDRIRALAIPPAWTEVWISASPNGHIQATGRDIKGRKQYRYHACWRTARDGNKYDRTLAFGRALPRLRTKVDADLRRQGLPRDKVLAAVIRVMEITLIRVGNEEYAKQNKSFGLTTLRDRHARIGASRAVCEFRGKSGKTHQTGFTDRRLARIVKACQDLPGQRLFQYLDEAGERRAVESSDVNAYLREAVGEDFSAKDFRTWAGTVAAARALSMAEPPTSPADAKRSINVCVKAVAGVLGNTAAVCRAAYIHPAILEAFATGELALKEGASGRAFELAVLRFLEAGPKPKAKPKARRQRR